MTARSRTETPESDFWTPEQLIATPGWPVGRSATYGALRRGDIPSVRVGKRYLIPAAVYRRWAAGDLAVSSSE